MAVTTISFGKCPGCMEDLQATVSFKTRAAPQTTALGLVAFSLSLTPEIDRVDIQHSCKIPVENGDATG